MVVLDPFSNVSGLQGDVTRHPIHVFTEPRDPRGMYVCMDELVVYIFRVTATAMGMKGLDPIPS